MCKPSVFVIISHIIVFFLRFLKGAKHTFHPMGEAGHEFNGSMEPIMRGEESKTAQKLRKLKFCGSILLMAEILHQLIW